MQLPTLKLYKQAAGRIDIILHGGSKGMDSQFITKIFDASIAVGNSALAFNFPYLDRGDDHSSGEELLEEQQALSQVLQLTDTLGYKQIRN